VAKKRGIWRGFARKEKLIFTGWGGFSTGCGDVGSTGRLGGKKKGKGNTKPLWAKVVNYQR